MDFHLILIAKEVYVDTGHGMVNPIPVTADVGTDGITITTTIEIQHRTTHSLAFGETAVVAARLVVVAV